jgi:Uma2 family endonuclease
MGVPEAFDRTRRPARDLADRGIIFSHMTMETTLTSPAKAEAEPRPRRFTPGELRNALAADVFEAREILEVIDGQICTPDGARHPWTTDEYYRAGEFGVFHPDERLELIEGEVIEKVSPVGTPHSTTIRLTHYELSEAFQTGYMVSDQQPIHMQDGSEPEPDVYVAVGNVHDYEDRHPQPPDVPLIVEVADTSIRYDRGRKAVVYAGEGIPEYWIINLKTRRVEVYRNPSPTDGYRSVAEFDETQTISPLARPDAAIAVGSLLPKRRTNV